MKKVKGLLLFLIISMFLVPNITHAAGNRAFVIGRNYGDGLNTTIDVNNATPILRAMGLGVVQSTDPAIDYMQGYEGSIKRMESDILFFSGHANSSLMHFYQSGGPSNRDFYIRNSVNSSNTVGLQSYDMNQVKLIVWGGCQTSAGNNSITKQSVDRGAKAAIGWNQSIQQGSHTEWFQKFWNASTMGTIESAKNSANSFSYSDNRVKDNKTYGNWYQNLRSLRSTSLNEDDREHNFNINISNMNDSEILNVIYDNIKESVDNNFDSKNYIVEINNSDETKIIDLVFVEKEIRTKLGFTIFIEDNMITKIYDNMKNIDVLELKNKLSINLQKNMYSISRITPFIDNNTFNIISTKEYNYYDDETNNIYHIINYELENIEDGTLHIKEFKTLLS